MQRVRVVGHMLHPILVVIPLGLWVTSLVWDLAYLASSRRPMWAQISFWTIFAGIMGAILAAVPGFIDWLSIPERTRAKRVGLIHMLLNVCVLTLFIVSAALRYAYGYGFPKTGFLVVSWFGIALGAVSGWLGGELVERLGVGVYENANPNAPSSLARGRETSRRRVPPVGPTEPTPTMP